MSVENISITKQEAKSSQNASLAKSALGWINRVINGSVQEINDFSAMLSAQSAIDFPTNSTVSNSKSSKSQSDSEKLDNVEILGLNEKFSTSLDDNKVINKQVLSPKSECLASNKEKKHKQGQQKLEDSQAQGSEAGVLTDSVDEENLEVVSDVAVESDYKLNTESFSEEAIQKEVVEKVEAASNPLVSELIASQLQVNSEPLVDNTKVDSGETEIQEEVASSSPQLLAAKSENVESLINDNDKGLVEFARNAVQKASSVDRKSQEVTANQNVAAPNIDKVAEVEIAPQVQAVINKSDFEDRLSAQNLAVITPQAIKPEIVSNANTNLGLSQSYLGNWTSGYALGSAKEGEDRTRLTIDALAGAKGSLQMHKANSEVNASSAMPSGKAIENAQFLSDRVINMSFGSNGLEAGPRNEFSKGAKPLTRLQSLATLDRVEAALQKASEAKDGTQISLRLDPPDLGTVKVDVSFKEGSLHARISADSVQVLGLLREKAPELQVILRKLGLDVDKVSVSVNSGDSGMFNEGSDSKQGGSERKGGNNFPELADSAAMSELLNLDHWVA